jgi:hypothetical protein
LLTSKVMTEEEIAALARDDGDADPSPAPDHDPDDGTLQ